MNWDGEVSIITSQHTRWLWNWSWIPGRGKILFSSFKWPHCSRKHPASTNQWVNGAFHPRHSAVWHDLVS